MWKFRAQDGDRRSFLLCSGEHMRMEDQRKAVEIKCSQIEMSLRSLNWHDDHGGTYLSFVVSNVRAR